jgi:site-specific DNA recombinase
MANADFTDDRACIYLRKSTDQQEQSIGRQRDAATRYAAARRYRVMAEYADEGIAGDVFDRRPEFQKMLAAAGRGEFGVILVDEPSRLSRQNPIELLETVIAPLRRHGVKIDTVSKGPLDYGSLAGLIMMTVHAHKSEDESRDLSRRVLGGLARRALAGEWFGWVCPYGLRVVRAIDPASGEVLSREVVFGPEEEVLAVRFIFDAVANRGWPLRRVCRGLEARGIKPPVGNGRGRNKAKGLWNHGAARKILRNRKYVGDLPWNELHTGKYSAWRAGTVEQHGEVNRRASRNGDEDVIVIPDLLPALIDRDTFARAAAVLKRNQGRTSPGGGRSYLFTHLLVCGDCGAFLHGRPVYGHKGYICASYKAYGAGACASNTVREDAVMAAVIGAVKDDILSPARLDAIEAKLVRRLAEERASGEADRLRQQVKALDRDIAQGNANLARLPEDRLPGVIAQVRQWEGERAGLLARLNEMESGADQTKAVLAEAGKQLWRLRESLENGDEEAQVAVIREVVSKVEVRFEHKRTHGKKSQAGQGRVLNRPCGAVLYVRPGLGLSCLVTTAGRGAGTGRPSTARGLATPPAPRRQGRAGWRTRARARRRVRRSSGRSQCRPGRG